MHAAARRGLAPHVRLPHARPRTATPSRAAPRDADPPPSLDFFAGVGAGHENDDGPTLVPLDIGDDSLGGVHDGTFGPLALLLVGYDDATAATVIDVVDQDLGAATILPVLRLPVAGLESTLADALDGVTVQNAAQKSTPPLATRADTGGLTAAIISGATPDELQSIVGAVTDADAAPDLWCAAVPANWSDRSVRRLVEDIAGDAAAAAAREMEG